jgi:hypothetical protein
LEQFGAGVAEELAGGVICLGDAAVEIGDEDGVGGEFEEGFVLLLAGELALLGEKSVGGFGGDDECAADLSAGVADWTVAIGPIDVFQVSISEDGDELILVPGCLTAGHDGFDLRSDDGPYLRPALDAILSQSARMLVGAEAGAVGVVIELDEVFAPPQKHRVPGGEHGVDGDEQCFRPLVDRADGGLAPVERASAFGHLAGAEDGVLAEGWGSGPL